MQQPSSRHLGTWVPGDSAPEPGRAALVRALEQLDEPFAVVHTADGPAVARGGETRLGRVAGAIPLLAHVPALEPHDLGDPQFRASTGVRVAYVGGAMANGIGSTDIAIALARAGMVGFFGAAGLSLPRIADALDVLQREVGDLPWGANLIHSPAEPEHEQRTVELYLERGVRLVSTSAYMGLTPMVVQLRASGLEAAADGSVRPKTHILAKVSRPEVAERFLRPPPTEILRQLVSAGRISDNEAKLAATLPMADDLTAEADSGGHTDNRPLPVLLPLLCALRDRVASQTGHRVRVGAAGGIGSPRAAAGAFAMGAAYVLVGTVHQACVEAGTSDLVRRMLAEASMADVAMAPASDMFEGGVQVQVLKRGTLFAQRGATLYELYRAHPSLQAIGAADAKRVQQRILGASFDEVWERCVAFFSERDPAQLERAAGDPKHKMALVFRWYLGLSSRWAIGGEESRRTDLQIWCGPGIGTFNDWTAGTFLAEPHNRQVAVVGANLMAGAAFETRLTWLRAQGVDPGPIHWRPRPLAP
ncbi:MAG: PfaD family polyunsaturated fatty acid/polyketide biosynthesis protein [Myxococcales bacterium]|nr:PfaD family polyunsaturated fatty acid/polyketide biosynthesis protein [Myxococcales bacterium]